MPITILAEDFLTRQDLETYIQAEFGQDIQANKKDGIIIKGTRKELKELNLSDTSNVWGVKCKITDFSTKDVLRDKDLRLRIKEGKKEANDKKD